MRRCWFRIRMPLRVCRRMFLRVRSRWKDTCFLFTAMIITYFFGCIAEFASAVENQIIPDTSTSRFTWYIENFSKRNVRKHYSDDFTVGGYKWRVLVFPRGNNVDYLSMYLDVADSNLMPPGWSRNAQFSLAVVNQLDSKASLRKEATHQFNSRESDWGFTSFMPLLDLYDSSKGYVVNDKCIIEAEVAVRKTLDFWNYDSKRMTGYVGLKNQGATCYMNSLLQTLYHIPYFRKAVYHMPTTENDTPSGNIPLALQSLFYKLQHSDNSVATKELTKSFGWDSYDSFMQHDVQELNRVLCEKLENKMKGTTVEGAIQKLFEGHHMNYIECINVESKSTRKESFYDLALDVKGCSDVYASFDKYVAVERLEGDNKYQSEEHGLQDAKKGMLFIDFPPVLQLQLKRFEYDFVRDTMLKINDRYEFPLQLDLDRDDGKYLSPDADRSVRNLYTLHSVLVHSGGVHGGHYYAFIRPKLSDQWYKFEDERVTKEDMKRALEEQYGGEEELPHTNPGLDTAPLRFTKHSNAYMLVYIRESDKDNIICDLDDEDISEHLKVARDFDIKEQIGRHMHFDLVDFDRVNSFRAPKNMSINEVKIGVLKDATVAKLPNSEVRLFLEVHFRQENQPIAPWNTKEDILLFFKLYDPEKEDLRYVGNFFVKASGKPSDIVERLNQIAGFLSDEDIELYEIDNGDIICYQKHCLPDSMDRYRYPTVPSFFEYIHNRQIVHFRLLEKPKEEGFSLELSKCSTYDDVVEKVAKQLRMDDPSKIRLTQHNPSSQQPKPHFIKYRSLNYLSDMLHNHNQMCDILYYDILDIPLPELESMRSLKVAFQNAANHEMSFHIMRLPKSNSLLDLIEDLKSKVEISCNDAEFRFFGVYLHKICKVYQPGDKIDSVNDHGPLYIEEVPEDEKNAGPHDRLVHVYHFEYNHHIQYFGEPFFFLIRDGEALSDMKVRIQKRLQVPDEQFLKWKFAHVTFSKPEYLQDSDIVMNRFHKQRPVYGGWEQHLGLEHTATTPKRSYLGNNQNRHSFEKPVRIYN
ncbi:Ubiquitin carboxyl-terminal hydrolase 13 [Zea mays]|uniref:ubiquitinyl hydrolase 1 n=1 Tax=Zea mays TaxID=4577 RepID=A0A3L6FBK4_MAIZE|nr:Ubiquitin carboxyl-terminal hydrolase 13 [Zea mays]